MNVQHTQSPLFLNPVSASGATPLLEHDLEKNAEVSSAGKDTFNTGGALILVACAAQGAKCFVKQPEFKPTTKYTDLTGIIQKCGVRPYQVPVSDYYMQGCSADQNACNDVPLDESWCHQPPECVGKPTVFNCDFMPRTPLTGSELVSSCFKHQVTCLADNMLYSAAKNDFLQHQAKHDSTCTNLNYLTGAALLGVLLARVLGRGHHA